MNIAEAMENLNERWPELRGPSAISASDPGRVECGLRWERGETVGRYPHRFVLDLDGHAIFLASSRQRRNASVRHPTAIAAFHGRGVRVSLMPWPGGTSTMVARMIEQRRTFEADHALACGKHDLALPLYRSEVIGPRRTTEGLW